METIKIMAYKPGCFGDSISLCGLVDDTDGESKIISELVYAPYKRFMEAKSFATLTPENAQALMDNLWTCGVRPTEGKGSAGAMVATENHLKDMRAIVSDRLKIML